MLASTDVENQDEQLWRLVYASAATKGFAASDLDAILRVAREHNAGAGITGMLLLVDPSFLQVLEGTNDHIDELFERIRTDRRHTRALLLLREPIEQRSFPDWTMGATTATLADLEEAVGINNFFQDRWDPLHHLGDTKLRTILELFHSGSYRQRLT
jgi:hypothetical protein